MHAHFCDTEGHYWDCTNQCECICGLPCEVGDHSDCPIELRACPDHEAEAEIRMLEAMFNPKSVRQTTCEESARALPHCGCGCIDTPLGADVGFCLYCDHVYTDFTLDIQARHFADQCPEPPERLQQAALTRLARG